MGIKGPGGLDGLDDPVIQMNKGMGLYMLMRHPVVI